jgi:hypothetical protein
MDTIPTHDMGGQEVETSGMALQPVQDLFARQPISLLHTSYMYPQMMSLVSPVAQLHQLNQQILRTPLQTMGWV